MRVIVHLSKFYDWVPVPADVTVTTSDIQAERVKPASGGGWLMKVTKEATTHTQINLGEHQVIAKIIHEKTRPEGGRTFTRRQAVAFYLAENVMPHHAHRLWFTDIKVHDDGPDLALFRSMMGVHLVSEAGRVKQCIDAGKHMKPLNEKSGPVTRCLTCGCLGGPYATEPNIDPKELDAHVAAYSEKVDTKTFEDSLRAHFKVKPVAEVKGAGK